MSTTTSITTTYAGEAASGFISTSLLSGTTLDNGLITVKPNIKYKEVLKKISTDDVIKSAGCDFDPTSTLTMTEQTLEPTYQQVNLQLCKKDFQSDWMAESMGYSAFDSLPPTFASYLIGHVGAKVSEKTEQNIWNGTAGVSGSFAGFKELMLADASVTDIAAAGGGITSDNVLAELAKVADSISSTIVTSDDLFLYVSQNVARAFTRALGGFSVAATSNAGINNEGPMWYNGQSLSFEGLKMVVANGLADNTIVAAEKSNLFFGTGLLNDSQECKVLDMSDLDGSQNVRIIMRFSAGVNFGIGSEITLYS